MGAGLNHQSGDSIALDWQPCADFSVLRSRKRELLAEQRSRWAEGRPPEPEELMARWPTNPETDPDAAALIWKTTRNGEKRRRSQPRGIRSALPRPDEALEQLLARNPPAAV